MVWCWFWAVCSMVLGIAVKQGVVLVLGSVFNVVGNWSLSMVLCLCWVVSFNVLLC